MVQIQDIPIPDTRIQVRRSAAGSFSISSLLGGIYTVSMSTEMVDRTCRVMSDTTDRVVSPVINLLLAY